MRHSIWRLAATEQFPEDAYARGMKVYTTLIKADQVAAYRALRRGALDYDRRHGYRGVESYIDMANIKSDTDESIDVALQEINDAGDLFPAQLGIEQVLAAQVAKGNCRSEPPAFEVRQSRITPLSG